MSKKGKLFFVFSILSFVALSGLYFALKVWMPFMWFVIGSALVGLIGWIVVDKKIIIDFFSMKTTKQGMNMGVLILISFCFLSVVNYVGAKHYGTFDFSANKLNSLSDQSRKILLSLEGDLNVKFFYKNGADRAEENKRIFRELVKKYQDASSRVQIEFVEMNEKAKLTQDFGAGKGYGEAFIDYKGSKNRIENYTEQDFTNAIIKLTRKKKKTIYFLEGHGERSTDDEKDETALYGFKQLLEKNSYIIKKLSLGTNPQIPEDMDTLVIAAPTQAFQDHEIKALELYLNQGGSLMLALDDRRSTGLEKILGHVGLQLEKFYVFNVFNSPMGQVVNAQSPTVAAQYSQSSEITKMFTASQMTVFRQPHALTVTNTPATIHIESIAKTPENSVALKELDSVDYQGKPQPFNIAVELKGKYTATTEKDFSMVVFADTDFMSNILLYQNLNRDLALNTVASLAKEVDLISVSPKEAQATKILLSPPEFSQFFTFAIFGLFLPLPLLLLITSSVLWFKRRHA